MTTQLPADASSINQVLLELGKISTTLAVMDERLKAIPDHENRIRELRSEVPFNLTQRLSALEKWRYALPVTGLLAISSTAVTIWAVLR